MTVRGRGLRRRPSSLGSGSVNNVGLAVFGADSVQADMTPAGGDDALGAPADGNTAINSIVLTNGGFNYELGQYTLKGGNANGTNYSAALTQALAILGATVTEQVAKQWRDTTPPVASCTPTTNPSGKNVPPAGNNPGSGQKPDGFYVLLATDDVDPSPDITVSDTGSSFVAGPYASGTKIKLTQAPGATPKAKLGEGDIDWRVTLKGDAVVTATDGSGNSVSISCKVPPPPK